MYLPPVADAAGTDPASAASSAEDAAGTDPASAASSATGGRMHCRSDRDKFDYRSLEEFVNDNSLNRVETNDNPAS